MARGPVELWLGELQQQQQSSLHSVIKAADIQINDTGFQLLTFLNQFQAQVGGAAQRAVLVPLKPSTVWELRWLG